MNNQESHKIIYIVVTIVVIIAGLFAVTYYFKNDTAKVVVEEQKAIIKSFVVERPNFIITTEHVSGITVVGVPTGTDVTEESYLVLGSSSSPVSTSEGQVWNVSIPADQILLANIYAIGKDAEGVETDRFYFPLSGATDIYNALWLDTPSNVEEISVGQEVIVNDIQIVLKEVTDSRCPTGAQCIQAGEAKAVFEITGQGKKESITLSSVGSNQVASHGYLFSIKDVKPLPNLSTEIKQPDYRVTLLIEQENKG